jgi:hypothetical protein
MQRVVAPTLPSPDEQSPHPRLIEADILRDRLIEADIHLDLGIGGVPDPAGQSIQYDPIKAIILET